MCVLSETNDADEEVQVYLHRLKESQSKQEMLERDLKRTENDLQNLQQENMQLKAEARAWKAHSEGNVDSSALQAMNDEMERTRSQLTQALQENAQLREELIGLQEISHGDGDDPEDSSKVVQLREALTVALQVRVNMAFSGSTAISEVYIYIICRRCCAACVCVSFCHCFKSQVSSVQP